jgi:glycosyltransferase involved in cell wall biosynthesis
VPPLLSIVVPVHNEAEFLPIGLPGLFDAVDQVGSVVEVIVVENGSTDGSSDVARELIAGRSGRLEQLAEADYGAALRHGFLRAEGEWIVNVDVDYYSAAFFRSVVDHAGDADLVIGSKRDPGSDDRRPLLRRAGTRVFNLLLRCMFGSGVSDTHGMKGFRRSAVAPLVVEVVSRKDLFDTELVLRAERAGLRIVEVPVVVEELRPARSSFVKRVPRTLTGLWAIRRVLPRAGGSASRR